VRAILYSRTSYHDRERISHEEQLRIAREYAQRKGYRVIDELSEDERGVSGADFDAPELNRAVTLAQAGEYDVLIVRDPKRFSRDARRHLIFRHDLREAGVDVEYVTVQFGDDPISRTFEEILAVMAGADRLDTTQRLESGRRASVRRGNVMVPNNPPLGYAVVKEDGRRTFEIVEDEARWIRQIFDWYINGIKNRAMVGMRVIAAKLTELRVPTATDRGKNPNPNKERPYGHWPTETVRRILQNRTYAGEWTYTTKDGEEIVVEVPAIVDRATFERAERRRAEMTHYATRHTKYEYLFGRRVTCECGYSPYGHTVYSTLVDGSRARYQYYTCPATRKNWRLRRCDSLGYSVERVDAAGWEAIVEFITNPATVEDVYEQHRAADYRSPVQAQLEATEDELVTLAAQQARLVDLYVTGRHGRETVERRLDALEASIAKQEQERARLLSELDESRRATRQLETLKAFSASVRDDLLLVGRDFEGRRWVVDQLDAQLVLFTEEGHQRARLYLMGLEQPIGVFNCG